MREIYPYTNSRLLFVVRQSLSQLSDVEQRREIKQIST